ncbi:MAG: MFS transporter [Lachnospiraceae bacterium]|nr:MFS transporter [Lachnospiraceae bacterium]
MSRELGLDKDGMQKHLRGKDYLADAMGQIMLNSISAMAGQMTFFYINKVGMAAAAVATLLLLAKIVDAVTDLFMGKIVDKTNTPEGKARPWLRRMIIPGALSIILLFTVPAGAGSFRYVYAFLTNIFASAICYTAIAVPYYTMMNYQTRSSEEKGKLGTFRAAVGYAVGVGLGIGLMPITGALGDDQRAWVILACCMSVISALGLFTAYRGTREIYHDDEEMSAKEASISIVRGIGILIHNKYWIIITIFGVLMNIVYAVVMAAPIYYAQVIVGNQNFYSTVNTAEVNMQKYGVRITGMTNASNSFVGKIGSGLGGSAIGWILAAGGYDAYAATGEATGKVIGAVNVLNVYIPIAIFVVMALILFRYDLEEKLPEIRRENDRRMADHPAEN